MATKKATTTNEDTKTTKAKVVDDGMEEIFIPIDYSNPDEMNEYIAVNGVGILVPKGETVKVKREYAQAWAITNALKEAQMKQKKAQKQKENAYTQQYVNSTN